MECQRSILVLLMISLTGLADRAAGQDSNYPPPYGYQGRLTDQGVPANGVYDIEFRLFDTNVGGTPLSSWFCTNMVVANGLFNALLDLDPVAFFPLPDSAMFLPRFLELGVRRSGSGQPLATLISRQLITPAPMAHVAGVAAVARSLNSPSNQPVSLSLNGQPALRLFTDYGPTQPPNLIVGYSGNLIAGGVVGAVIGGGGAVGAVNQVSGDFGTVAGGFGNSAGAATAGPTVVPRGNCAMPTGIGSAALAGGGNIAGPGDYAVVSGGQYNVASASWSAIAGGSNNVAAACYSTVTGGRSNRVNAAAEAGVIGGGDRNLIEGGSPNATVGGGSLNFIHSSSPASLIAGGAGNDIQRSSTASTIAGGQGNRSGFDSDFNFVGGGQTNVIQDDVEWAVVGGGWRNTLQTATDYSTICGGHDNAIQTNSSSSTIAGGASNLIGVNSDAATISGGRNNVIGSNAHYSTVSGGASNEVALNTPFATVAGGSAALAEHYGQFAYAHGSFAGVAGSAQTSLMVPYGISTNYNIVERFLDGPAATRRMFLRPGATWTFDVSVSARSAAGQSAGFNIRGVIENVAGATALVGPAVTSTIGADPGGWTAMAVANDADDALVIRVQGLLNTTVRWVASVRTSEVLF